MNIEELREQLDELAGPQSRPTVEARAGVRRRVDRQRRRRGATSGVAAVLIVAIAGVGVWSAQRDSPVHVSTVDSTTPRVREFECETGVDTVPKTGTPMEVFRWAAGAPVVGGGALWTVRSLLSTEPMFDNGIWRAKIGWFTRPFGIPLIVGRRLDGPGTLVADANQATDHNGTWAASTLEFSHAGCWEVTTSYAKSKVVFRILVGDPPRPLAVGTITGTLRITGGPSTARDRAIAGTIRLDTAETRWEPTTATGEFTFAVPVGRYSVYGMSPAFDDGRTVCTTESPVVVERGRTTQVTVACERS